MRTIELMLGGIIVVSTFVDIFQSIVVPRPTRGSLRLAPFLLDGMWPLWKWIALRFPSAKHRAAFLGIYVLRTAYADALHSLMKYWVVSQRKF